MSELFAVYKAIAACMSDLAKEGISKDRSNQQQGYKFRGIDDVYDALAPILSKHGLCFLPRILSRQCEERQTAKGGTLFYVTVEAEFDLVSAEDGSKHTVRTFGEAMDSADKATNKAMSAAYKYAAFQSFCIPCEGEDADAATHVIKSSMASEDLSGLDPAIMNKFKSAQSMEELQRLWQSIDVSSRHAFASLKDEAKNRIGGNHA